MTTKTQRIAEIVTELRQLFPDAPGPILLMFHSDHPNWNPDITFQGFKTNTEGTTFMRELGIGERKKQVMDTESEVWHSLQGEADGVTVHVYCAGLPPSCKIVQEKRMVPKKETRETGEFIEVPFSRVVCGNEPAVVKEDK